VGVGRGLGNDLCRPFALEKEVKDLRGALDFGGISCTLRRNDAKKKPLNLRVSEQIGARRRHFFLPASLLGVLPKEREGEEAFVIRKNRSLVASLVLALVVVVVLVHLGRASSSAVLVLLLLLVVAKCLRGNLSFCHPQEEEEDRAENRKEGFFHRDGMHWLLFSLKLYYLSCFLQ